MRAVEKRDLLVKEVLKPLLKEAGFKTKKLNWWKELEDGYLFMTMKNSIFNSQETGCDFCFQFSASYKGDIRDKIENQWIYNQSDCIEERAFLPHMGYLSPNRDGLGYRIDGYRNYQPVDVPVEEIIMQIKMDFEKYIMPYIMKIQRVSDFAVLKGTLQKSHATKENRLLRYYSVMQMLCCDEGNLQHALQVHKECSLTTEDIRSHYDWLGIIRNNSMFPDNDAEIFIEKVLLMCGKE